MGNVPTTIASSPARVTVWHAGHANAAASRDTAPIRLESISRASRPPDTLVHRDVRRRAEAVHRAGRADAAHPAVAARCRLVPRSAGEHVRYALRSGDLELRRVR